MKKYKQLKNQYDRQPSVPSDAPTSNANYYTFERDAKYYTFNTPCDGCEARNYPAKEIDGELHITFWFDPTDRDVNCENMNASPETVDLSGAATIAMAFGLRPVFIKHGKNMVPTKPPAEWGL